MSQRQESSKTAGKRTSGRTAGKKAGKRGKSVSKKQSKRRSGQHSTDPSTPKAKLQDKLREAQGRQFRSARTNEVVGAAAAPTGLDQAFDAVAKNKAWAIPVILVAVVATGAYAGVGTALLVLAGSILLLVISAFWASVQSLTGEADLNLDEALSLAAPSAELEQKRATLRALKDLEFEHNIGKISDDDYKDLSARYRAEAKRLLQQLSDVEAGSRKRAEELFNLKLLEMSSEVHLADEASEEVLKSVAAKDREKVEEVLLEAAIKHAKAKARGQTPEEREPAEDEADHDDEDDHEAADHADEGEEADRDDDDESDDDESDDDESDDDESDDDESDPAQPESAVDEDGFVDDPVTSNDDPVTSKQGVSGPSRRCRVCETRNILANDHCSGCNEPLARAHEILCSACPAVYVDSEDACPVCGVAASGAQD